MPPLGRRKVQRRSTSFRPQIFRRRRPRDALHRNVEIFRSH